ncbi:NAD(P)-binding protein, partial [Teratosphaeria destructans]
RSIAASIQGTVTGDPSPHLRRSKSAWTLKRSKSRVHVDHDQRPTTSHGQRARECSSPEPIWIDATGRQHQLPAPPPVPASSPSPTRDRSDSKLSFTSVTPRAHTHKEKTLSIIYTPHGISLSALRPYLDHHLHPITSAHLTPDHTGTDRLPVTALFHGLNTEQNPWFMGGLVSHGAPKGIELAKALRPRHWVSAHDEQKENRGLSVSWIKSRQYSAKAVQAMLEEGEVAGTDIGCSVKCMAVGEVFRVDG